MIFDEKQLKELEKLAKPLVKFLNENGHPHVHVTIDCNHIQLWEAVCGIPIHEFLED